MIYSHKATHILVINIVPMFLVSECDSEFDEITQIMCSTLYVKNRIIR